ncbi:MAG: hypothetical protein NTX91_02290 [candidate division SR1 bacterium]|nr:hypothetical protein [candidate division SR1 bacterium]
MSIQLEKYTKYKTASEGIVALTNALDHENMLHTYSLALIEILGIDKNLSYENKRELLKDEVVIHGLTSNMIMPGADWHQRTGKCLRGNSGGALTNAKDPKRLLAGFDIKIDADDTNSDKQI